MPRPPLIRSLALLLVLAGALAALAAGPGSAQPKHSDGLFVIGDLTAAQAGRTGTVTWWSHSWWTENQLTGGPAPAAFKGLAVDLGSDQPTCGDTWTTGPGNSVHPPADVPDVLTVLVADAITKSGDTITGNIVEVVHVATDPGYGPNPGHPGTGRIVDVVCGGSGGE